jgi:hypothetical protein
VLKDMQNFGKKILIQKLVSECIDLKKKDLDDLNGKLLPLEV